MRVKDKYNEVGVRHIKLDDKTKSAVLLLVRCAEELFDKAKIVTKNEVACLNAAQYLKDLCKDE